MADLFAGPHAPLSKAFLFCGWRRLPVDIKLDVSHDLSNPLRQDSLRKQLNQVDFIAAAFDCSTKSRAREIPRHFEDGRPAPKPFGLGPCQRDWRGPVRGIRSEWTRTTRHVLLPSRPFEQQPSVGQARCGALAFAPGGPILPVGAVPTMTHAAGAGHGVKGSACATTLTRSLPGRLCSATTYTARASGTRSSMARSVGTRPRRKPSTQRHWYLRSQSRCLGGLPELAKL